MALKKYLESKSQAGHIIDKFGGARPLAKALGMDPSAVYRWTHPREKGGSDGLVPTRVMPRLLAVAREHGILFTADELFPRYEPKNDD